MEVIDCLGQACPLPVIRTKKALREVDAVEVLVDNEIATQNLAKMAQQLGYEYQIEKLADRKYQVQIHNEDGEVIVQQIGTESSEGQTNSTAYTVVIDSDVMGSSSDGNVELGRTLIKSFVSSLLEQDVLPSEVVLYNAGVKLATDEVSTWEDLKALEDKGVSIFSCGLCTDYYGVTDKIQVGTITNMFAIVAMLRERHNIVKP